MASGKLSGAVTGVRRFFAAEIWGVHRGHISRQRAALYRVSRVLYSTVRGFFENELTFRAAALTYFTVLSVVPFLAFAFAVLKGFGAYRTLVDETVRPYLADTFAANATLYDAFDRILDFVEATDVSKLGTLGVVFLVYTSVTLVSNVEIALNEIFGAKTTRPLLRQVTDYVTLLVTTPILVLVATTVATAAQSSSFVVFMRERLALGPVIDVVVGFTPILAVAAAFFAIYVILPNVRTRLLSAAIGALTAAFLWQGALVLHVQSQMGVARYNALYSVLGAIPIFLVWTYVSWLIVLVGAQLAASHQNEQETRQRFHARGADEALKETIAIAVAARITRDYLAGGPRRTAAELAQALEVPLPVLDEVLGALVRGGLLVRALCGREIIHVPGRDVDEVRVKDLRDALRRDPQGDRVRETVARRLGPELHGVLRDAEDEAARSPTNLTLRELAALAAPTDGVAGEGAACDEDADARPVGAPPPRDGPDVVDAKQPDVPA